MLGFKLYIKNLTGSDIIPLYSICADLKEMNKLKTIKTLNMNYKDAIEIVGCKYMKDKGYNFFADSHVCNLVFYKDNKIIENRTLDELSKIYPDLLSYTNAIQMTKKCDLYFNLPDETVIEIKNIIDDSRVYNTTFKASEIKKILKILKLDEHPAFKILMIERDGDAMVQVNETSYRS